MTELWVELSGQALIVALAAGFVFGLALPGLFSRLTEPLIPEEQVDILNAAAGVLVPLLALPIFAAFFTSRAIDDVLSGGSAGYALGRFLVSCAFVAAVTFGDLLWQRLRGHGTARIAERVSSINRETDASYERLHNAQSARLAVLDAQVDAQRGNRQ